MENPKYILFGAGEIGKQAVVFLGAENIEYIVDNNKEKEGTTLFRVPVHWFNEMRDLMAEREVIITVSGEKISEIKKELLENKIEKILSFDQLKIRIQRQKILERTDYIAVYKKAIHWIFINSLDNKAIINSSRLQRAYPEVTGYFIPSLLHWGYRDLAISFAKWLCEIQKEDGSWYDTEDLNPYIFDSAQILKGLLAIKDILPEVIPHIKSGCDWILSNIQEDGRLPSPRENDFGDEKTYAEVIHVYCLSPLVEAAELLNMPIYKEKAYQVLNYYKNNFFNKITNFDLLSHFYAYVLEGLLDMGEREIVGNAMEKIARIQKEDGAVPGYHHVDWVCSTGLFQFALIWFKLGEINRGNLAFEYACKLQNESGGWYGSYSSKECTNENNIYFPDTEISWAIKYFLDALYWKNRVQFEYQSSIFKPSISKTDGRYKIIKNLVDIIYKENKDAVIADIGCGKGAYLKNLREEYPNIKLIAVDLSEKVMEYIDSKHIETMQGSLTNIPYLDNSFDMTYACESLEHAVDIERSIREMARVTKTGGYIAVIDKNKDKLGYFEIEEWEQWFDEKELRLMMEEYCSNVIVNKNVDYEEPANGLFYAWIGQVK